MSDEFVSRLLASIAEDFDLEVVERSSDRVSLTVHVSEQQRQAAMSRVIAARADLRERPPGQRAVERARPLEG